MVIHDVSLPLHNGIPVYPGDPEPLFVKLQAHERGDEWSTSYLAMSAHTGTHVDAPLHRIRGGSTIDRLNLATLMGQAYVADFTEVVGEITAHDLQARNLPPIARLLLKTRNGALWAQSGFQIEYVALSRDGAEWLVEHGVRLVGMDYLSVDVFTTQDFPAHAVLLEAGIVIVEGLVLQTVEAGSYTLICLPMNIAGADGAPARALLLSDTESTLSGKFLDSQEEK